MKIENIIRRVLREQEEEKLLKIPSLKFFNNDWNILQKFLESQGYPRYSIGGDLDLREMDIESLENLVRVEGDLNLFDCKNLQSIGNLEYVGGDLNLRRTDIETLGNLEYVGGDLELYHCLRLKSLGDLEYVGGDLDLNDTPIRIKYRWEEIRNMVEVGGYIFM